MHAKELEPCAECGMHCEPGEYHPFTACLLFKACHDSTLVRESLQAVRNDALSDATPAPMAAALPAPVAAPLTDGQRDALKTTLRWIPQHLAPEIHEALSALLAAPFAAQAEIPQATVKGDECAAFGYHEASEISFAVMEQYRADHPKWWKRMDGTPILNDLPVRMAVAFSEALSTAPQPTPTPTPIYQIGAPGIAGHTTVWWDVPQGEYERQRKAGYMKTGIVYREPS